MNTASEEKNWTVEIATFCPIRHRKAEWHRRVRANASGQHQSPLRGLVIFSVITRRLSAGLRTRRRGLGPPTGRRFPVFMRPVLMTAFVPAYRCGAVPDFHRVPFSLQFLKTNSKMNIRQARFESQHEFRH